jgi:2-methylfumaryl-CoA isomerase
LGKIVEVMINATDRPKDGNYLYGAFGRDFETLDDKRLMVVGLTRNQWSSLVETTGLADRLEVLAKRLYLDFAKEGDRFRARTVRETIEHDPDCSTRNPVFGIVEQPEIGTYLMPGSPLRFSALQREPVRPAPILGEHTDEILLDTLGLGEREIATI